MSGITKQGLLRFLEATPTIDTSAFGSGDLIGTGAIALTGAVLGDGDTGTEEHGGYIQSVVITDLAKQSANIDVVFFDVNPSNTSYSVNNAFDPHDTDILQIVGVAAVTDWKDFNDSSIGQAMNLAIPFVLENGNNILYAVLVSRGAPNYGTSSDLTLRVGILNE